MAVGLTTELRGRSRVSLWSLNEMERTAVNRTLLVSDKKGRAKANTFFMIIQRKILKTAEVFATTVRFSLDQ